MIQNQSNAMALDTSANEPLSFNDLISLGTEVEISESSLQQALRETESVWMKHHHYYAEVLENLMLKVEAARGIV